MNNNNNKILMIARLLTIIMSCAFVVIAITLIIRTPEPEPEKEIVYIESEPEIIEVEKEKIVTVTVEPEPEFRLTDEEMELLAGIVHAEAGNQDMIGRRLVADVVLNRMVSPDFPNEISGVIYQQNQFATPMNYTADDMSAVELECQKRIDSEVLWFRTGGFHSSGTPLYQHGAHYFSGRKE